MTDPAGTLPPFPGFPGFPDAAMLERMWSMMRLAPFGGAFPGTPAGQGFGASLSAMSDMMAPLTNVEELDKRITDLRAVEQWLKLNLSMLQSAIQTLEVQRSTLATLRAFGAFAESQVTQMAQSAEPFPAASASRAAQDAPADAAQPDGESGPSGSSPPPAGFDASPWWNLLQAQFNQLAQFAMTQPGAAAGQRAADAPDAAPADDAEEADDAPPRDRRSSASTSASASTRRATSGKAAPRAARKTPSRG